MRCVFITCQITQWQPLAHTIFINNVHWHYYAAALNIERTHIRDPAGWYIFYHSVNKYKLNETFFDHSCAHSECRVHACAQQITTQRRHWWIPQIERRKQCKAQIWRNRITKEARTSPCALCAGPEVVLSDEWLEKSYKMNKNILSSIFMQNSEALLMRAHMRNVRNAHSCTFCSSINDRCGSGYI